MGLDEDAFRALNGAGNPFLDPVMIALGVAGLFAFSLLWVLPLWLGKRRRDAIDLVALLLIDAVLVFVLKEAFQVQRPFLYPSLGARVLAVPFDDLTDFSFPSGHASRAFALALLLCLRTRDRRWAAPLFAYAAVMAVSRVYVGAHWPSDVVGGALLGLVWAYGFERLSRTARYASVRDRLVNKLEALGRGTPA